MGGQRRALIVATNEYEHEALAQLASPAADAGALAEVLGDPAIGGFDVRVVSDADAHVIQLAIEDLCSDCRPEDVLLLHFSCHGVKSESGELYFAARNTRPDRLGATAVPADFVQRCMRSSRSRSIVVLLDCCYGGAFGKGVTLRATGDVNVLDAFPSGKPGAGRGRAVITASNSIEYAFEGERLADNRSKPSVFTGALVHGLATGEADRDEDGWVSLNELYEYLFDRVRELQPNQTPSRDIEMQGDLYLARSKRRRIRSSPIPVDLRAAMTDANMFTRLGALSELRTRLGSPNLEVAAGAFEAVTEMAGTDLRNVADEAGAILRESEPAVSDTVVRFEPKSAASRTVRLLGPPLARVCTHETSHDWIRVDLAEDQLTISVDAPPGDARQGAITLTGPTGTAVVTVEVGTPKPPPAEEKPRPQPRNRPKREYLRAVAGILALLAGAAMIAGLFPAYMADSFDSWHNDIGLGERPLWDRAEGMYFLAIGWLVVLAGMLTLLRRTRKMLGPGLLAGGLPSAVWGLVFLIGEQKDGSARDGYSWGMAAHLALLTAVVLAVVALVKDSEVRVVRRPHRPMIAFAVAAAVTLFFHRLDLYDAHLGPGTTKASVVLIAAALVLPIAASMLVPSRLGMAVLIGWIATSAAVAVYSSTLFPAPDHNGSWLNVFLVLLAGFSVLAGRLGGPGGAMAEHGEPRLAGILAILAGAAMFAGLSEEYLGPEKWGTRPVFLLATCALTLVGGVLSMLPNTRRLTGAGLVIGTTAGAAWNLVFLLSDLARDGATTQPSQGFWLELLGHLVLVLAAVVAAVGLIGEVRLTRRPQWPVVALAVAGAVAFLFHRDELIDAGLGAAANASVAVILTTLVLPVYASVVVPSRLATAVLIGWFAATAAIVVYNFVVIEDFGRYGDWVTIFCVPLLGLVAGRVRRDERGHAIS